jgi:hypothetical protein
MDSLIGMAGMRVSKKDCPKASSGATRLWPRSNARGPRRGHESVAETLKIAERCPIAGGSSEMLGETLLRDCYHVLAKKAGSTSWPYSL